jgi:hypothetical protein
MSVFIIHGYFETLHEIASNKTLGTRECEKPESRELGEAGATTVRLTQDFTLDRGPKKKAVQSQRTQADHLHIHHKPDLRPHDQKYP